MDETGSCPECQIIFCGSEMKEITSEAICLRTMPVLLVNKTLIHVTFVLAGKEQNLD